MRVSALALQALQLLSLQPRLRVGAQFGHEYTRAHMWLDYALSSIAPIAEAASWSARSMKCA